MWSWQLAVEGPAFDSLLSQGRWLSDVPSQRCVHQVLALRGQKPRAGQEVGVIPVLPGPRDQSTPPSSTTKHRSHSVVEPQTNWMA